MKYLSRIKNTEVLNGPYDLLFLRDYFYKKCKIEHIEDFVSKIRCEGDESLYCLMKCPFSTARNKTLSTSEIRCSLSDYAGTNAYSEPVKGYKVNNHYEKYTAFVDALNKLRNNCMNNSTEYCLDCLDCSLGNGFCLCLCGGKQ